MNTKIDTYLYHVGRHLPQSQRKDILDELKANIYDQLEASGQEADDSATENLLLSLGSPEKVAREYTETVNCVIGPELVDTYWAVVKYVLMGVTIAFGVIGILSIVTSDFTVSAITKAIIQFFAQLWGMGLTVYGMITLIFTLVYSKMRADLSTSSDLTHPSSEWNLKALKALKSPPQEKDKVQKSEVIGELITTVVGFLILNAIAYGSNGNLGVAFSIDWTRLSSIEATSLAVVNSSLLQAWMPLINTLFVLNFSHYIFLMIKGKWHVISRVIDSLSDMIGLGVFLIVWMNPDFIDFTKATHVMSSQAIEGIASAFHITRIIVAVVVCVITLISVISHGLKLLKRD